ncbi:MAG: glutathione peroxidase [Bacteroidales bacterium]|nr:glutathione peroxidase [Bacteroidales bacterium]
MTTIYDFKALTTNGKELDFDQFRGKVLLIVNTASKCGFTPQFAGLEELNQRYKDQGLVVIGFPCNQFASQDPGSDEEISNFCQINYGVTFQMMKKIDVNGKNADPIFQFLKDRSKNIFSDDIKWNFTKFLVASDGVTVRRYAPTVKPNRMKKDIEEMLMVEAV